MIHDNCKNQAVILIIAYKFCKNTNMELGGLDSCLYYTVWKQNMK